MSGWGVITRTTLHLAGSRPAAITRNTTSLLVKMPAIFGAPPRVSITQTAVVLRSFMSLATSRTVVLGVTVAGCVRESMTVVKSGRAVFSRNASTYANMAAACGFEASPPPSSDCTPSSAVYSFCEAEDPRSTFSRASWNTLVISRRPTTLPSSLHTGYKNYVRRETAERQSKGEGIRTRCRKPLVTMSWRASVALVVSRVTMGFRVIIALTGVERGSRPSAVT